MRAKLGEAIKPRGNVLTLMGGDFNWVVCDADRRTHATMATAGKRDAGEEKQFQTCVAQRHGLAELHQPEMCARSPAS